MTLEPLKRAAADAALSATDWVLTLFAILMIGAAGVFLTVAWIYGPQVWVHAAQYRSFTARTDAPIVESWLALDIDLSRIHSPQHWRASAKASPCAVVELRGDWSTPIRRAYCGPRLGFNESYTLADLREIAPRVPFTWPRDERGFVVPEIRLAPAAQQWLASNRPDTFMHPRWPASTALDWLKLELDAPVDFAIAGWSAPPPVMTIAYDPKDPGSGLPAATVDERLAARFNWLAVLVGGVGGIFLWLKGISILPWLRQFTATGRVVVAALPLLAIPWFADYFPRGLRAFNADVAEIIGDMFGDLDPLGRLVATDPAEAAQARGGRLVWGARQATEGPYADTFGRLRYAPPPSPFVSPDAALAALADKTTQEVAAMDDPTRARLFSNLARDKRNDLKAAGIVFMPAAKALIDAPATMPSQIVARQFLVEWLTMPREAFDQRSLGYEERRRLYGRIADFR